MGLCHKEKKFKVVEIKPVNQINNNTNLMPNFYMNNNNIIQNYYNKNINNYLSLSYDFLKYGCNIPENMFDNRGDCLTGWGSGKSGPRNYLKDYIPPLGWTGVGLKVLNLYDNGDNTWLGRSNNNNSEWYIGYHGTKQIYSVRGIVLNGFEKGPSQGCLNYININPLSNHISRTVREGVYFTPNINEAKKYTADIPYNGYNYKIVFMCRINPYTVQICNVNNGEEYWIVNGNNINNIFDEVRPYRILLRIEKNQNFY